MRKGSKASEQSKEKNRLAQIGKKLSKETKRKISIAMKGRKRTKKYRENISKAKIGSKNPAWKGGKHKDKRGYIHLLKSEHPFAVHNYVLEHRLVMEKHLGRFLKPEEVVHHINKDINNNCIENLMLFPNGSKHTKYHLHVINHI